MVQSMAKDGLVKKIFNNKKRDRSFSDISILTEAFFPYYNKPLAAIVTTRTPRFLVHLMMS